jgi:hypothetical protein
VRRMNPACSSSSNVLVRPPPAVNVVFSEISLKVNPACLCSPYQQGFWLS